MRPPGAPRARMCRHFARSYGPPSAEGFRTAAIDLILNLDDQLALFREKVKREPGRYKLVRQPD